jgi:hypothetical protein
MNHPIFIFSTKRCTDLRKQAAIILCKLARISHASINKIFPEVNHKVIEKLAQNLMLARMKHVEKKEKLIKFGSKATAWADVEADESVFAHEDVADDEEQDPKALTKKWEQWCGIVQRGKPETLLLHRLCAVLTTKRAPGPGAIRKVEWTPLAEKHLKNKKVVLHTDSAKSYKLKVANMIHDNVVHCKKRINVGGKWKWTRPRYTKVFKHKMPGGKILKTKGGTQVIDRVWRVIKDNLKGQNAKVGSQKLRSCIRSSQFEYWHKDEDMWVVTGQMLKDMY